jgi:hypothetical protein
MLTIANQAATPSRFVDGSPSADASPFQLHPGEVAAPVRVAQVPSEPPRDEIEPLDAQLSRLHITVDRELLQLLEAAKDAFAHSFPSGRAAEVIKHGLRVALDQHAKRLGLVEKPRKVPRPSRTNHIPAHVRRAVWLRAGGRCEWVLIGGALRLHSNARVRPHRRARARGHVDARERSPGLSASQSRRSPGVRGCADGSLRTGPFPGAAVADPRGPGPAVERGAPPGAAVPERRGPAACCAAARGPHASRHGCVRRPVHSPLVRRSRRTGSGSRHRSAARPSSRAHSNPLTRHLRACSRSRSPEI